MELENKYSEKHSDILVLPLQIQSANKILRQHWAVRSRAKKEYALFVRNQMKTRGIVKAECKKYKLTIISYRKRLLDFDNLVLGCKGLIDAMIDENLIYDDSPDYIDVTYEQYTKKEHKHFKESTVIIRETI